MKFLEGEEKLEAEKSPPPRAERVEIQKPLTGGYKGEMSPPPRAERVEI